MEAQVKSAKLSAAQQGIDTLRRLPLFANLNELEWRLVASLLTTREFRRGTTIISIQKEAELDLYMVRSGRAASRVPGNKRVDDVVRTYGSGDIFNLNAFVAGSDSDEETVEALTSELHVWVVPHDRFKALLAAQPELAAKLIPPDGVRPFWAVRYFGWEDAGEVVIEFRKKHPWVLLMAMRPIAFLLLVVLGLWLPPVQALTSGWSFPMAAVPVLVFALVWALWRANNWYDDYYAVTNRRVVHREKVLFFEDRRSEIPIARIQNVTVRRDQFANTVLMIDMADISIETSNAGAFGKLFFSSVPGAEAVSNAIFEQQKRAAYAERMGERDVIRTMLRSRMGIEEMPVNLPSPAKPKVIDGRARGAAPAPAPAPAMDAGVPFFLGRYLFPDSRYNDGRGNITYHRHVAQLVLTAGLQVMANVLYYLAVIVAAYMFPQFVTPITIGIAVLAALGLLFWLAWAYEDWRNDVFVLMRSKIVDIDRKPFGWGGIQQREAPMEAVQTVTSDQKGFVDWLFDMGDVTIKTGGAGADMVFNRVANPRLIQRDIAQRLDELRVAKEEQELKKRSLEFLDWIAIYDEMNRLPYDRKQF